MTKAPHIRFIYDRYKKASLTRKAAIEAVITYNRRQKYLSTGIMLYPNQWKNNTVVNSPDAVQLNQTLDKLLIDIRQILFEMSTEGNIDIFAISERIKKKQSKLDFLGFCKQRATIRKYGKEEDTQERYNRFIRLFEQWGRIIEFEDVNEGNIIDYDRYLSDKGMKPYSKWNNYHRFLNSFILDAIDEGYLKRNPYKWINIQKDKSSEGIERYLTPDEFCKIKNVLLPTVSLNRVRDVFVFQTYTCLSYSDLKDFNYRMVQEVRGMKVYVGCRNKTNRAFTIPLLSPALNILHKYEGKLPVISNPKYNEYLKLVAQAAGIDKPVSAHWARHTGATMLLNEGVDMKIVARICGHSSTKITEQVYAKLLDETVVDAIQEVSDKL